ESKVKPGGILIYDPYGITKAPTRSDINIYATEAMDTSIAMNAHKSFNMFILGGLLKIRQVVDIEYVMLGLKKSLPERHHHLLPANEAAIKKGMELIVKK
ncbi:MAG TPA: 2-oxoacid:acceptor oxidoreductase family protein, partial [Candidatus Enterocola sp.]|nr:2-oxoacid:acceptor oxidoreductase family protein [Candidatus Enterocola sp.]